APARVSAGWSVTRSALAASRCTVRSRFPESVSTPAEGTCTTIVARWPLILWLSTLSFPALAFAAAAGGAGGALGAGVLPGAPDPPGAPGEPGAPLPPVEPTVSVALLITPTVSPLALGSTPSFSPLASGASRAIVAAGSSSAVLPTWVARPP